ncbi:MAG: hypothetical protein OXD43_14190 [Bacteroidetes bacterium]|nr:hypothetical protein [Bacteroidota bacterium]
MKRLDSPLERSRIHLICDGPDVEQGTISATDMISILNGFASAYRKLVRTKDPQAHIILNVVALKKGSVDIVIEPLASVLVVEIAKWAFRQLQEIIKMKKHAKGESYKKATPVAGGNISLENCDDVTIIVGNEAYETHVNGKINRDLDELTKPLSEGKINSVEVKVISDNEAESEKIDASERQYFEQEDLEITSSKEELLIVKFNSLTKSTNNGRLYLEDGPQVPYHYAGDTPEDLYKGFGTNNEWVSVKCIVKRDGSSVIRSLDILEILPYQFNLFPDLDDE